MNRAESLHELKWLHDQVHQTAERAEHLEERMPLHVHPESLNYGKDLTRLEGEYNRAARRALEQGWLTEAELAAEGLPAQLDRHK